MASEMRPLPLSHKYTGVAQGPCGAPDFLGGPCRAVGGQGAFRVQDPFPPLPPTALCTDALQRPRWPPGPAVQL